MSETGPLTSAQPSAYKRFRLKKYEMVEDGGPSVRHADKLPPIQPPAALPPASPPSDPVLILVLCLPPLTHSSLFLKPRYKPR
ncbi:hypothetical protein VZT92_017887 [Zoarces viviparus]|uniref:Uncharacterized protein n=1 Tax=Zoarces viviparus TaxID=48416 RepID=A0AAW1EPR6_ZOAVI